MKDSTRRALRTAYHGLLALLVGVPTWIPLFDTYVAPHVSGGEKYVAFGAVVVAFAAAVSKVINKLEDAGLIPAYLKAVSAPVAVVVAPPAVDVPAPAVDVPVADVPVADVPVADVPVADVPADPANTPMGAGNDQATPDPSPADPAS